METTTKKVFVDAHGIVALPCPICSFVQKKEAAEYKNHKMPIEIKCKCGNIYQVEFEFRKEYRKETNLEGLYLTDSKNESWGKIIIKDITLDGCKFETIKNNQLRLNEEIRIEFRLKNVKNSLIRKRAIIRSISNNLVGCQFKQPPNTFDPDLGFFLRQI